MNLQKSILLLLAILINFGVEAKKKEKKSSSVVAMPIIKLDTCAIDSFSYSMGMVNTKGLKGYLAGRMNVDTIYMESFLDGFTAPFTTEERKKLQAFCAGLEIHRQVTEEAIPALNKRVSDNDSVDFINTDLFLLGFYQVLAGLPTEILFSEADSLAQAKLKEYTEAANEHKYGDIRRAGEEFLRENATRDSVNVLPSGVQYKVLSEGHGVIPQATSKVKVNYEGRLIDGTVFDSSYKRKKPASFTCNQLIKGWTDALTHMPVGSTWELYIPQELAYGARESGKIPPFSALIFTVELLDIE